MSFSAPDPATVVERLRAVFERRADADWLVEPGSGRRFSYARSWALAGRLAEALRQRGLGPESRVALVLPNSAELALLYLACLRLGAVAMPLNPDSKPAEAAEILAGAKPALLLHSTRTEATVAEVGGIERWQIAPALEGGEGERLEELPAVKGEDDLSSRAFAAIRPENLFSITFTSGTTALPKGVAQSVASLLTCAEAFNEALGFDAETRMLHSFPMSYMAGFFNTLLGPLMAGGTAVIAGAFDARMAMRFWEPVIAEEVNALWVTPTILSSLLKLDRHPRGKDWARERIRRLVVGTAPLPASLKVDFEAAYACEPLQSYGLSELLYVTHCLPGEQTPAGSVGRLVAGVEVRILDGAGKPLPRGEEGELQIRTPYLMAGYLAYETGAIDRLEPGSWFVTGDLARLDENDALFITGRLKDLIIRGGMNVSPLAVEEVLLRHEAVEEAAVVGLPDPFYGEEVTAVLRLTPGRLGKAETGALRAWCRERLAPASQPTRFFFVEDFPRTPAGKVRKAALKESLAAETKTAATS